MQFSTDDAVASEARDTAAFGVKFLAVVALSINKTIRDLSEKSNLDADRKYRDSILTESLRKLWLTVNRLPEKFAR